jgi:hypothetical protein
MRWTLKDGSAIVVGLVVLGLTLPAAAGALAPGLGASFASGDPLVIEAKHVKKNVYVKNKTVKINKNVYVNKKVVVRPYKAWARKPYYGTWVAGVALGTILAVNAIPPAPAPNLCWYWANPARTRGYWDYCY